MKKSTYFFPFVSSILAVAAVTAACSKETNKDDENVGAQLEIVDQTRSALTAATIGSVTGTYGGLCNGRAAGGTDTWVFDRTTPANTTLSVVKNDSDCVLTLTSIVTPDGAFLGNPVIPMGLAYKLSGSAFALSAGPLAFYGNAKLSGLSFSTNFIMSLVVSDSPSASDAGSRNAAFAQTSSTMEAGTVPAPNYTASFSSFMIEKDNENLVDSVSGFAQLTVGSVVGQEYAIYVGAPDGDMTLAEVEAMWAAGAPTGTLASLTTLQLPASGFLQVGVDLDTSPKRTILIKNTVDGVTSYQLLTVTFVP